MPPQPNCPSNGVFACASEQHKKRSVVLHYWLTQFLTKLCSNASHIRYTTPFVSQHQTTVKFYGVFTSHWRSLVFTPEQGVQRIAARDSGDLVTPFMHVTIQMTRHFATLRKLLLLPPFAGPWLRWNGVLDTRTGQTSPPVQGFSA